MPVPTSILMLSDVAEALLGVALEMESAMPPPMTPIASPFLRSMVVSPLTSEMAFPPRMPAARPPPAMPVASVLMDPLGLFSVLLSSTNCEPSVTRDSAFPPRMETAEPPTKAPAMQPVSVTFSLDMPSRVVLAVATVTLMAEPAMLAPITLPDLTSTTESPERTSSVLPSSRKPVAKTLSEPTNPSTTGEVLLSLVPTIV